MKAVLQKWYWRFLAAMILGIIYYFFEKLAIEIYNHATSSFGATPSQFLRNVPRVYLYYGLPAALGTTAIYARLTEGFGKVETRCRKCAYILKGITEPRCPECGERI